jgi:outer membrane immunogenic protein
MRLAIKLSMVAAIASISFVGAASAADMPVKARPMPAPVFTWTGCYIGGNVGGKWAHTSGTVYAGPTPATGTAPLIAPAFPAGGTLLPGMTGGSPIGGAQVGCNYQIDHWVFGIEADADGQNISYNRLLGPPNLPGPFVNGDNMTVRDYWEASVRGRVGYAWDRLLIYGTGGVSFTTLRAGANYIPVTVGTVNFPYSSIVDSANLVGPTVGAGVEYMFTQNWSWGLEGRYTWYGTHTFNGGNLATTAAIGTTGVLFAYAPTSQSLSLNTGEVMFKLNYHFGPFGGPVVARY